MWVRLPPSAHFDKLVLISAQRCKSMVENNNNAPTGKELGISGDFGIKTEKGKFDVYPLTTDSQDIDCTQCNTGNDTCPISRILSKANCPEQSIVVATPNCPIIKITAIKV